MWTQGQSGRRSLPHQPGLSDFWAPVLGGRSLERRGQDSNEAQVLSCAAEGHSCQPEMLSLQMAGLCAGLSWRALGSHSSWLVQGGIAAETEFKVEIPLSTGCPTVPPESEWASGRWWRWALNTAADGVCGNVFT